MTSLSAYRDPLYRIGYCLSRILAPAPRPDRHSCETQRRAIVPRRSAASAQHQQLDRAIREAGAPDHLAEVVHTDPTVVRQQEAGFGIASEVRVGGDVDDRGPGVEPRLEGLSCEGSVEELVSIEERPHRRHLVPGGR